MTTRSVTVCPEPERQEYVADANQHGKAPCVWMVPPTALKEGRNKIEVCMSAGHPAQVVVVDMAIE